MNFDFNYFGLDWACMALGLTSTHLIANKNRLGFLLGCCASMAGLIVAVMSHQNGFIVYNTVAIFLAARGYLVWKAVHHQAVTPLDSRNGIAQAKLQFFS